MPLEQARASISNSAAMHMMPSTNLSRGSNLQALAGQMPKVQVVLTRRAPQSGQVGMSAALRGILWRVGRPILGRELSSFPWGGSKFIRLQLLRAFHAAADRGLGLQA